MRIFTGSRAPRLAVLPFLLLVWSVAGCGGGESAPAADGDHPVFGNGARDNTRVVARVDGEEITERMLDMRYEELVGEEKARFAGENGRRLLLRKMVEELLRVRDAEARKLQRDPDVQRALILQYRQAMDLAQRGALFEEAEPTIDEVREYFANHRDEYVQLGMMQASHIVCEERDRAQEAYEQVTEHGRPFANVVAEYSENAATRAQAGELGWFNEAGFVPNISNSKAFTTAVWDLEVGVHPPLEFGGDWHVVKVHTRKPARPQTLDEAYDRVVSDLLEEKKIEALDAWLEQAQARAEIEYFGEFRPGEGKTAEELLERALYANDPEQQADLLRLLIGDYPDDEATDDALFTAANLYLDTWGDTRRAGAFLRKLVREFPESEYVADAEYILENMNRRGFQNPRSIEDLRKQ
jgi:parvulin-like peptidyl-prolyl isomerase